MDQSKAIISIVIENPDEDAEVVDAVQGYAVTLCENLGLPVVPETTVSASLPTETVTIGGRRVALPFPALGPETLADRVSMALFNHRTCFVSLEVAEAVFSAWRLSLEKTDLAAFHAALKECVALGRRIDRLQDTRSAGNRRNPTQWLENALSSAGLPGARLELSPADYATLVERENDDADDISALLKLMSDGLFWELSGLFRADIGKSESLPDGKYRLHLNDVVAPPRSRLPSGMSLVHDTADRLKLLGYDATAAIEPVNLSDVAIVSDQIGAHCAAELGLITWRAADALILELSACLRANAGAAMTLDVMEFHASRLQKHFPDLVKAVDQRFGLTTVTRVCRALLASEISIRNLRGVFEALLSVRGRSEVSQKDHIVFGPKVGSLLAGNATDFNPDDDVAALVEQVRVAFRQYISHKYTRGQNTLAVYLLDPEIERMFADNQTQSPDQEGGILSAMRNEHIQDQKGPARPALLTTVEIRAQVRHLVSAEFPALPVLSYNELSPDMNIQPIARITVD